MPCFARSTRVPKSSAPAPASGPGSAGSFVLLCPHGSGAAARLDVGKASPVFPDIHCYPTAIPKGPGGHHIPFPAGSSPEWEFSNTAGKSLVISPTLRIFTPGGTAPLATALARGWLSEAGERYAPTALGFRFLNDLQLLFVTAPAGHG